MLSVSDLSLVRGGVRLIEGLSFEVSPGSALIVRGPNGVGKTTLLRTLVGLQASVTGTISASQDDIAYAAHLDAVKPTLSVSENLTFWAKVYGASDIDAALDAFDLQALRSRIAAELSAGQKRRLGLARLVLTGRQIWALDEPTVALDVASVERFQTAVQAHLSGGGIAVIATHIDLGIDAQTIDLGDYRARQPSFADSDFDEAFL